MPAQHVRSAVLPLSPARIAAAVERIRLKHFRAVHDCGVVLGFDSALTVALTARVAALADAARLDDVANGFGDGSCSIAGGSITLETIAHETTLIG